MKESRGRGFAVHVQGLRDGGRNISAPTEHPVAQHELGNLLEGCGDAKILVIFTVDQFIRPRRS
jgi:hypothetical protein